jgi:arylesterase/paraoxonase
MISPNDLLATGPNTFYFTNDHKNTNGFGRFAEDFLGHAAANVIYYDGKDYREVASSIAYPNGINWDQERKLLYVASSRGFLVKVFQVESNGDLSFIENIKCKTGVDNIEIAPDGSLWIGCHPSLMTFANYAQGKIPKSPSEIIRIEYRGKGDYEVEQVYLDDGTAMAAASVAAPYKDYIFLGNVMDDYFLVLKRN